MSKFFIFTRPAFDSFVLCGSHSNVANNLNPEIIRILPCFEYSQD